MRRGLLDEALELAHTAVDTEAPTARVHEVTPLRFALAEVRWEADPTQRSQTRRYVEQLRADLVASSIVPPQLLSEMDAWLEAH